MGGVNQRQVTQYSKFNRLDFSMKTVIRPNWTVSFSALNLLGETDVRHISTFNGVGAAIDPANTTYEATYRAYQVRSTVQW